MKKKPNGYWNLDRCKEEALKYTQRSKFEKGCGSAYMTSMKNGWLDIVCSHMISPQKKSGHWTVERCIAEAKKYSTASEFMNGSSGAYDASVRLGVYTECSAHMKSPQKPKKYWSKKKCLLEAMKFSCRSDFAKSSAYAYQKCIAFGCLEDACRHMDRPKSDSNIFYIWKTSHFSSDGVPVYKIGVTSKRLGMKRINHCKGSLSSKNAEVIIYKEDENSRNIEAQVKEIGSAWGKIKGNGYTELRVMDDADLKKALNICRGIQ